MRNAIFLGACMLAASPAAAQDQLAARMLAVHNVERLAVGHAPLQWDQRLADGAASYALVLGSIRRLVHSPRETRPGQSENLAMATRGTMSPEQLVNLWSREKLLMSGGSSGPTCPQHVGCVRFPSVSRTGNWADVGHYTQMVWPTTTHVGCAIHSAAMDVLVCRYSPKGNIDGKPVFVVAAATGR